MDSAWKTQFQEDWLDLLMKSRLNTTDIYLQGAKAVAELRHSISKFVTSLVYHKILYVYDW